MSRHQDRRSGRMPAYIRALCDKKLASQLARSKLPWSQRVDSSQKEDAIALLMKIVQVPRKEGEDDAEYLQRIAEDSEWHVKLHAKPYCWLSMDEYYTLYGRLVTPNGKKIEVELLIDLLIQAVNYVVTTTADTCSTDLVTNSFKALQQEELVRTFLRNIIQSLQNPTADVVVEGSDSLHDLHTGYFRVGRSRYVEDNLGQVFQVQQQIVPDLDTNANEDKQVMHSFHGEKESVDVLMKHFKQDVAVWKDPNVRKKLSKGAQENFQKVLLVMKDELQKIEPSQKELEDSLVAIASEAIIESSEVCLEKYDDAFVFGVDQAMKLLREIIRLQQAPNAIKPLITFTQIKIDRNGLYDSEVIWPPQVESKRYPNKYFRGNLLIIGNTISLEKTIVFFHLASAATKAMPFDDLLVKHNVKSNGESKIVYILDTEVAFHIPVGIQESNMDVVALSNMALEDKLKLQQNEPNHFIQIKNSKNCKVLLKEVLEEKFAVADVIMMRFNEVKVQQKPLLNSFIEGLCKHNYALAVNSDIVILAAIGQILQSLDSDESINRRLHAGFVIDNLDHAFPAWALLQIISRSPSDILPLLRQLQPHQVGLGSLAHQLEAFMQWYWNKQFANIDGVTSFVLQGDIFPKTNHLLAARFLYDLISREVNDEHKERAMIVIPSVYEKMLSIAKELQVVNWDEIILDPQTVDFKAQTMKQLAVSKHLSILFVQFQDHHGNFSSQIKRYVDEVLEQGSSIRIVLMENDCVVQWNESYLVDYSDMMSRDNLDRSSSSIKTSPFPRHQVEHYQHDTKLYALIQSTSHKFSLILDGVANKDSDSKKVLDEILHTSYQSSVESYKITQNWKKHIEEFFSNTVVRGSENKNLHFEIAILVRPHKEAIPNPAQCFKLERTMAVSQLACTTARNVVIHDFHLRSVDERVAVIDIVRTRGLLCLWIIPALSYDILQCFNYSNTVETLKQGNIIHTTSITHVELQQGLHGHKYIDIWMKLFDIINSLLGCTIRLDDFLDHEMMETDFTSSSSMAKVAGFFANKLARRIKDFMSKEDLFEFISRVISCLQGRNCSHDSDNIFLNHGFATNKYVEYFSLHSNKTVDGPSVLDGILLWCMAMPKNSFVSYQIFRQQHLPSILSQNYIIALWLLSMLHHATIQNKQHDEYIQNGIEILKQLLIGDIPHMPSLACLLSLEIRISIGVGEVCSLDYIVSTQGSIQSIEQTRTLTDGNDLSWNQICADSSEFDAKLVQLNSHKLLSSLLLYQGSSFKLLLSFDPLAIFNISSSGDSIKVHSTQLKQKLIALVKWYDQTCDSALIGLKNWDVKGQLRQHMAVMKYCLMVSEMDINLQSSDFSALIDLNVTFRNLSKLRNGEIFLKVLFELNVDDFDLFSNDSVYSFILMETSLRNAQEMLSLHESTALVFGSCFTNFILNKKLEMTSGGTQCYRYPYLMMKEWALDRINTSTEPLLLSFPAILSLIRRAQSKQQVTYLARCFWYHVSRLKLEIIRQRFTDFFHMILSQDWNIQPLIYDFIASIGNSKVLETINSLVENGNMKALLIDWKTSFLNLTGPDMAKYPLSADWIKYQLPYFRVIVRRNTKCIPWEKEFYNDSNGKNKLAMEKLCFQQIEPVVEEFIHYVSKKIGQYINNHEEQAKFLLKLSKEMNSETLYQIFPPLPLCNDKQREHREKFQQDKDGRYTYAEYLDAVNWILNPTLPFEPNWHHEHVSHKKDGKGCPAQVIESILSVDFPRFEKIAKDNKNRLGLLAKFYCFRQELPADIINDFLERIIGPVSASKDPRFIRRKLYCVGQFEKGSYPEYYVYVEIRPVSASLREKIRIAVQPLLNELRAPIANFDSFKMLMIDRGVNEEIFINNMRCLHNVGNNGATEVYLQRIICAWFLGLDMMTEVCTWLWPNLTPEDVISRIDKSSSNSVIDHMQYVFKTLPAKVRLHEAPKSSSNASRKLFVKREETVGKLRALTSERLGVAEHKDFMEMACQYLELQLMKYYNQAIIKDVTYIDCFHHLLTFSDLLLELQDALIELTDSNQNMTLNLLDMYKDKTFGDREAKVKNMQRIIELASLDPNQFEVRKISMIILELLRTSVNYIELQCRKLTIGDANIIGATFHRSLSLCIGISPKKYNEHIQNVLGLMVLENHRFRLNSEVIAEINYFCVYKKCYIMDEKLSKASGCIPLKANKNPTEKEGEAGDMRTVTILKYKNYCKTCTKEINRLAAFRANDQPPLQQDTNENTSEARTTPEASDSSQDEQNSSAMGDDENSHGDSTRPRSNSDSSKGSMSSSTSVNKYFLSKSHLVSNSTKMKGLFVDLVTASQQPSRSQRGNAMIDSTQFNGEKSSTSLCYYLTQIALDCRTVLQARPISQVWENSENQRSEGILFQSYRLHVLNGNMHTNACELYVVHSCTYIIVVFGTDARQATSAIVLTDQTMREDLMSAGQDGCGNILAFRSFTSAADFSRFLIEELLISSVLLASSYRWIKTTNSTFEIYVDGVIKGCDRLPLLHQQPAVFPIVKHFHLFKKLKANCNRRVLYPWEALIYSEHYKIKLSDQKVEMLYQELCRLIRKKFEPTANVTDIRDTLRWFLTYERNASNDIIRFDCECICFIFSQYFESIMDPKGQKGTQGMSQFQVILSKRIAKLFGKVSKSESFNLFRDHGFQCLKEAGHINISQGELLAPWPEILSRFSTFTDKADESTAFQAQRILLMGVDISFHQLPQYRSTMIPPHSNVVLDSFFHPPMSRLKDDLPFIDLSVKVEKSKTSSEENLKSKVTPYNYLNGGDGYNKLSDLLSTIAMESDHDDDDNDDDDDDDEDDAEEEEYDGNSGINEVEKTTKPDILYDYDSSYVAECQQDYKYLLCSKEHEEELVQRINNCKVDGNGPTGMLFDSSKECMEIKNLHSLGINRLLNISLCETSDSFNMNKQSPVLTVVAHEELYGLASMEALQKNNHAPILDWIKLISSSPLSQHSKEFLLLSTIFAVKKIKYDNPLSQKTSPSGMEMITLLCVLKRAPVIDNANLLFMTTNNLLSSMKHPEDFEELCSRKDRYGVRLLPQSQLPKMLSTMQKYDIPYVAIKENESTRECSSTDEAFYLRIRNHFYSKGGGLSFIIVEGLDAVRDRPLKWIAELTEKNPWMFVIFVNTTHLNNWPENCDRLLIVVNLAIILSRIAAMTVTRTFDRRKDEVSIMDIVSFLATAKAWTGVSAHQRYWKDIAHERLMQKKHIYLVGPPGIGKTQFFEGKNGVFKKLGSVYGMDIYVRIDCSDEKLILYALNLVIQQIVSKHEGKRILLFFDEFHMINEYLRKQCVSMLEQYPHVVAAFVANRIEDVDSRMEINSSISEGSENKCEITMCRGEIVNAWKYKLPEYLVPEHPSHGVFLRRFIELYSLVVRGLCGEELMSLRYLEEVMKIMKPYLQATNDAYISEVRAANSGAKETNHSLIDIEDTFQAIFERNENHESWNTKMHTFSEKLLILEALPSYCLKEAKASVIKLARLLHGKNPTFEEDFCETLSSIIMTWFEIDRQIFIPPTVHAGQVMTSGLQNHDKDIQWEQYCTEIFPSKEEFKCVKKTLEMTDEKTGYCYCHHVYQQDRLRRHAYQLLILDRILQCSHQNKEAIILVAATVRGGYAKGTEAVLRRTLSYPEFCKEFVDCMNHFQRLHPARKLATFVTYCFAAKQDQETKAYHHVQLQQLEEIFALVRMIDFTLRFPRLEINGRREDLSKLNQVEWKCEVARAEIRDMSNLQEIKEAVQRGNACGWDQLRKYWSRNTIVDPNGLTSLLFVSKDCVQDILAIDAHVPATLELTSTERKNLLENYCELIHQDPHSCTLAQQFLPGKLSVEMAVEYDWLQPRYHAAWKIFLAFLSHEDIQEWYIARTIDNSMNVRLSSKAMKDLDAHNDPADEEANEENTDNFLPRYLTITTSQGEVEDFELTDLLSWAARNAQSRNRVKHADLVSRQVGYILFAICQAVYQDSLGYNQIKERMGRLLGKTSISIPQTVNLEMKTVENLCRIFDQTWLSGLLKTSDQDVVDINQELDKSSKVSGSTCVDDHASRSDKGSSQLNFFPSILLAEILNNVGKPSNQWNDELTAFWRCLYNEFPHENDFAMVYDLLTNAEKGDRHFWYCESHLRKQFLEKLFALRNIPKCWQYEILTMQDLDVDCYLPKNVFSHSMGSATLLANEALVQLALNFREALEQFGEEVEFSMKSDPANLHIVQRDIPKRERELKEKKLGMKNDGKFKQCIVNIIHERLSL